jgi:hypothetical protein
VAGSLDHARTSALPEKVQESPERDRDCGRSLLASLGKYDRDTHSLKTHQCSLIADSTLCSVTLPRWGMMHDGVLYPLKTPELHTRGNGSGLWPTPIKQNSKHSGHAQSGPGKADKLSYAVVRWPTPTKHNAKETNAPTEATRNTPTLASQAGGKLNPTWVEWLMGWPLGHTDLQPLEMDKFRQWLNSHGIY